MIDQARSLVSRLMVRTRGVMISPAVRLPNSTERSISSAVSGSRVPSSAEREIREASSVDERAERSSSCGSIPSRRTIALAEPLSSRIGSRITAVNMRWKPWVARAVSIGRAIARFLGTSSANTMVTSELIVSPIATATGRTAPSGTPAARSGPSMSSAIAGSARKPIARLVIVMPTWAPESWVDSERRARWTPAAGASPVRRGPRDLVAVDGHERELGGDEDAGGDHEEQRDAEQDPGGQHGTSPAGQAEAWMRATVRAVHRRVRVLRTRRC